MSKLVLGSMCLAAILVLGCSKKEAPSGEVSEGQTAVPSEAEAPPPEPAVNHAAAARTLFKSRCAVCHGENGTGDGPGAAALTPKPRNYTDQEWQKSVTDEDLAKTIVMGGAAVGKSPIMPASPDLAEKPEVVSELVKIIRKFGGQ
ncbi:MAG TPA: cytochrome c [Polyangiaceae bacterium]|nr:cytochrome c [Polyangiaceae bacterium]